MSTIKDVEEIWRSRHPLLWINSFEERRIIDEVIRSNIVGLSTNENNEEIINVNKKVYIWSCTQGLIEIKNKDHLNYDRIKATDLTTLQPPVAMETFLNERINPETYSGTILILRDIHKMFGVPMTARKIRDSIKELLATNKTLIMVGSSNEIPNELQKDVYYIDYEYPDADMIRKDINSLITGIMNRSTVDPKDNRYHIAKSKDSDTEKRYKVKYTEEEYNDIIKSAQGLTKNETVFAISKSIYNTPNGEIDYLRIAEEKKNIIKRSQVLEIWTRTEPMNDVGGNEDLKKWLIERSHAVTGTVNPFGIRPPKGVLVTGIQGAGKSMLAKAVAEAYKLPLVRLDMGKIFAGLVGSSEKNMRDMIAQIESLSPAVLWIDEIEKGLSGTGSSNFSDGGTSSRVFGTFISWMQDKVKPIFIVATANDVSQLPAELLRKGRFDAIWFVDLPTEEERKEIFKIQLQRIKPIGRDASKFDIEKLAKLRYEKNGEFFDYSGAEIEESINDALFAKFSSVKLKGIDESKILPGSKYDITTEDIIDALSNTIPISCTAQEKINKIRKWGHKHARFASSKAREAVEGIETNTKKKSKKTAKISAIDLGI